MGHHGNAFISFAVAVAAQFASMYESFQALTSVQVTHLVEWFSGSVFDSDRWVLTQVVSSGTTAVIDDSIDGGIVMNSNSSSQGSISTGTIQHYDPAEAIFIASIRHSSTIYDNGYGFSQDTAGVGTPQQASFHNRSASSFILGQSGDGSVSETATDVPPDLNSHVHKIELTSSNILYTMDGVLKLTKTTNRPTTKQMPILETSSANGAGKFHCYYLECFNTSISILSSLYERLSELTQVLSQRMVETFSGAVLNSRWNKNNLVGTNTFQMADEVDGGFEIVTGTGGSDNGQIDFNNKRQYDPTECVMVAVARNKSLSANRLRVGLGNTGFNVNTHVMFLEANTQDTNFELATADATLSFTATSIALDSNFHSIKIEGASADIKLTLDGVLEVTKTTNRPTLKVQPQMYVLDLATSSAKTGQIRYLEAYNKLATETDFPSVYELFNELTTIAKQHFWEWFDGDALSDRWTQGSPVGTPVFGMEDAIDGGFKITCATTANEFGILSFNDKRQYAHDGAVSIGVTKSDATTQRLVYSGLVGNDSNTNVELAAGGIHTNESTSFYVLDTADATTRSATDSSISLDTVYHVHKIETGSANVKYTIDGVLEVTKTTNRPTAKLQPAFMCQRQGADMTGQIRYLETLNT